MGTEKRVCPSFHDLTACPAKATATQRAIHEQRFQSAVPLHPRLWSPPGQDGLGRSPRPRELQERNHLIPFKSRNRSLEAGQKTQKEIRT